MIKKKRGELTSSYIITTVLVIAGFVVVLYFILNALDLGGETTDDVCAFSVLTRATSPQATSAYVPLKCKTKKICLSDKGDCKDFKGEENVQKTTRLSGNLANDKEVIEKTLANQMYECWNMMGEGKLDLFNGGYLKAYSLEKQAVTCVICSRIIINHSKLDNLMKYDGKNNESKVNVEKYMEENQIEGKSETYLQYFAKDRSVNGYRKVPEDFGNDLEEMKVESEKDDENIGKAKVKNKAKVVGEDLSEYAIVFTQIKPEDYMETLNKITSLWLSVAVTSSQVPIVGRVVRSGPGLVVAGIGYLGVSAISMSNVHQGKVAAATYCSDFQNKKDSKDNGCSSVQILPYQVNAINDICSYIEGDP